jgi:hypothetical protein
MNELQINDWAFWFLGALVLVGVIGHFLIYRILLALIKHTKSVIDDLCIKHCYRPLQWILILLIIRLALPAGLPEKYLAGAKHILSFFFIGLVSLLFIKTVYILDEYLVSRFSVDVKDNLKARKIHTQLNVLK